MEKLPPFIIATGEKTGHGIILENSIPTYAGKVICYPSLIDMQTQLASKPPIAYSCVTGYTIAIVFVGVWGSTRLRISGPSILNELQAAMDRQKDWWVSFRLNNHEPSYKRFKL